MAKDEIPREAKPFFEIPLDKKETPRKGKPPNHDRFNGLSGRLELEVEVVSEYLYVGSGRLDFFNLQAYYSFARCNGQLVIPGAGIKGAVRSIVEAISNSCVQQVARGERARNSHQACKDEKELCPACRLFGTTGYRGRAYFSDAVPVGQIKTTKIKIADLWSPRLARGRKFYQAKSFRGLDMRPQKGHRFIEVVPSGAHFLTTLYFENTIPAEMGLLMRAMGLDLGQQDQTKVVYAFPVKLGGAKPRCLGAAYLRPKRLHLISKGPAIFAALLTGGTSSPVPENIRTWLEEQSLLDRQAWEKFRKEAKLQKEACPMEVY